MFQPVYSDPPRTGLVEVADTIFIQPLRRVRCPVRVLAARETPDTCSGADYAGLDVFVAHGPAVTPLYHLMSRLHGAHIGDDSLPGKPGTHERAAFLSGMEKADYKDTTHLHVVTAHLDTFKPPKVGAVISIDICIVNIIQIIDGNRNVLAQGSGVFGTLRCPWVIPTSDLQKL